MQKRKKHLLGLAGLALVGAMTVAAYAMPTSEAAAVSTGETTVRVSVASEGDVPAIQILSLKDDDVVLKKSFTVTIGYTKATELKIFVKNNGSAKTANLGVTDPSEGEVAVDLSGSDCAPEKVSFSESEQFCNVEYHLPGSLADVDGVSFTTRAVAINGNESNNNEDSVSFVYRSAYLLDFGGEYVSNGDPIMEVKWNSEVKSIYIEAFDENGKRVEIPSNTAEGDYYKLPLVGNKDVVENEDGTYSLRFSLPLWEANAKAGNYTVAMLAYSTETPTEDGLVALATADNVKYQVKNPSKPTPSDPTDPNVPDGPNNPNNPDRPTEPEKPVTPETPDTGLNLFKDLNISRADYIITGLIAFGMVTAFAAFLMIRRSKR